MNDRTQPATNWVPVVAGILVTPLFISVAAITGGGIPADYFLAKVMFPWAMLSMIVTDGVFGVGGLVLAIFQYPVYGLAAAKVLKERSRAAIIGVLLVVHLGAVLSCYLFLAEF